MKSLTLIFIFISLSTWAQSWTETSLKEYWKTHEADEIEGIYIRTKKSELFINNRSNGGENSLIIEVKYYVIKNVDFYLLYSFSGDFQGTLTKVYNSNKYFLSTNLKYFAEGKNEPLKFPLIFSNSEFKVDNFKIPLNDRQYFILNDVFSLIWKPDSIKNK